MVQFSIFVLEEDNLAISGGAQLDGIGQGNGSHLVTDPPSITITLLNNNFLEVLVDDSNDENFNDSDNSQTLDGAQTLNETLFADGLRIEAEYSLTVTDGTDTFILLGFNVNEPGVTSFATVEGLAFVGGEGEFPPIGVPLTVIASGEGPSVPFADLAFPPCFAGGTKIRTDRGYRLIETLEVGDLVWTKDHGFQPIRWIGSSKVDASCEARSPFAPVRIRANTFGPKAPVRDLWVTQQHRILLTNWRINLLFDDIEALAPAKCLVNGSEITIEPAYPELKYWHILFDDHQLVDSEGLITESFDPGVTALSGMDNEIRGELIALFPQLARGAPAFPHPARRSLLPYEVKALTHQMGLASRL